MNFFSLEILTPSKVFLKEYPCQSIYIPTTKGEINILPEHTHLLAEVCIGLVTILTENEKKYLFVSSGVCKINQKRITLMVRSADSSETIDKQLEDKNLNLWQEKLSKASTITDKEYKEFYEKIETAKIRLKVKELGTTLF